MPQKGGAPPDYHTSGALDRSQGFTQAGALAETSETGREHPNLKAAAAASTGALVDKLTLKEHLVDTKTRAAGNSRSWLEIPTRWFGATSANGIALNVVNSLPTRQTAPEVDAKERGEDSGGG